MTLSPSIPYYILWQQPAPTEEGLAMTNVGVLILVEGVKPDPKQDPRDRRGEG